MNAYEVRQQMRRLARQKSAAIRQEKADTNRHHAEVAYIEAFTLVYGHKPKILKALSTSGMKARTQELFAEAHERELCQELQKE